MIVIAPLYGTDIEWRDRLPARLHGARAGSAARRRGDPRLRALGLALESPDDLSRAHEAMRRAHERKTGSQRVKR